MHLNSASTTLLRQSLTLCKNGFKTKRPSVPKVCLQIKKLNVQKHQSSTLETISQHKGFESLSYSVYIYIHTYIIHIHTHIWYICNSCQVLEWAAQGGGGVTNPGGVQGTFGHSVEGHGLSRTVGDGWRIGLGDPVGLFQPWWFYDSMKFPKILQKSLTKWYLRTLAFPMLWVSSTASVT